MYDRFEDVHKNSFKKWWTVQKKHWMKYNDSWLTNAVEEYSPQKLSSNELKFGGIEPLRVIKVTNSEGKSSPVAWGSNIYLKVTPFPPIKDVFKSESECIDVLKKQFEKIVEDIYKQIPMGITKKARGELEKYLQVYDYRQLKPPMPYKDIVKKFHQIDDTHRVYRRYKEKAEKIIKNVEKGNFQGRY